MAADRSTADADFAEAFKDLARGERTAAALESHLDALEKKIEELLERASKEESSGPEHQHEQQQQQQQQPPNTHTDQNNHNTE